MEKTTQADEGGSSSHGAIEGHNDNKSSSPRTTYDGREERTTNERSATSFSTSSSSHQEWGPDKNHQNDYQSNESNQEHEDNDDDDDLASRGTARQKTKELPKRFPLKVRRMTTTIKTLNFDFLDSKDHLQISIGVLVVERT